MLRAQSGAGELGLSEADKHVRATLVSRANPDAHLVVLPSKPWWRPRTGSGVAVSGGMLAGFGADHRPV